MIERRDGEPFCIRGVQSNSDRISLRFGSCSRHLRWTVNVTIDGTSLTSRVLFGEASINTDVDDEPNITIPIILTRAEEEEDYGVSRSRQHWTNKLLMSF